MSERQKNAAKGMTQEMESINDEESFDCPGEHEGKDLVHDKGETVSGKNTLDERVVALQQEIDRMKKIHMDELRDAHALYRLSQQDGLQLEKDMEEMRKGMEAKCKVVEEERDCMRRKHTEEIDALRQTVRDVQDACRQHMVDPETQRMLRKYIRLSKPIKGFVFANYMCMKTCQKARLSRRRSRVKQISFVNMVHLESVAKLMQHKVKGYKKECKGLQTEIKILKRRLERKYQKEFDYFMDLMRKCKAKMQDAVHQENKLKQEYHILEQQLTVANKKCADHRKDNADLSMELRKMEAKVRRVQSDMCKQKNMDVQLQLFLQSCMYAMKKNNMKASAKSIEWSCMNKTHQKQLERLCKRVKESHAGVEVTALTPEDVRSFISLIIRRMNMTSG